MNRRFRISSLVPYLLTIPLASLLVLPALWALMASL